MRRQRQLQQAIVEQYNPANVFSKYQDVARAGSQVVKTDIPQATLGYLQRSRTKRPRELVAAATTPLVAGPGMSSGGTPADALPALKLAAFALIERRLTGHRVAGFRDSRLVEDNDAVVDMHSANRRRIIVQHETCCL